MSYLSGVSSHNLLQLSGGRPAVVLGRQGILLPQVIPGVPWCHDLCVQATDDKQGPPSLSETKQHKRRPRLLEAHGRSEMIWSPKAAMTDHRGILTEDERWP